MSFHLVGDWVNAKAERFGGGGAGGGGRVQRSLGVMRTWEGSQAFPILRWRKKHVNLVTLGLLRKGLELKYVIHS